MCPKSLRSCRAHRTTRGIRDPIDNNTVLRFHFVFVTRSERLWCCASYIDLSGVYRGSLQSFRSSCFRFPGVFIYTLITALLLYLYIVAEWDGLGGLVRETSFGNW